MNVLGPVVADRVSGMAWRFFDFPGCRFGEASVERDILGPDAWTGLPMAADAAAHRLNLSPAGVALDERDYRYAAVAVDDGLGCPNVREAARNVSFRFHVVVLSLGTVEIFRRNGDAVKCHIALSAAVLAVVGRAVLRHVFAPSKVDTWPPPVGGDRPHASADYVRAAAKQPRKVALTRQAAAGAETVVTFEDSSGNAIANASPLSMDERQAGKDRITKS